MVQKTNGRQSEGMCRRIYNAVSPLRATIFRVSHQPWVSILSRTSEDLAPMSSLKPCQTKMIPIEFGGKDILIVSGQKSAKSASRLTEAEKVQAALAEKVGPAEHKLPSSVSFAKAKSKRDCESIHEAKFSDYITKVKNRMIKTASHVGSSSGGGQEESFNDKATDSTNYRAAVKARSATNGGHDKSALRK